jgi:DNA-binding transcriptional LysR family regulator
LGWREAAATAAPLFKDAVANIRPAVHREHLLRVGSVRKAADSLALTHGAVSRRITKLSVDLGFKLLEKSGRGLRLTPAGETLNLTLGRFFGELAATVQSLRAADARQGTLVLSCETSVAMRWLIPRLGGFQAEHPDIAVHLSVGGGVVDFNRDRIDLAIRRLDFAMPDSWTVQHLFSEKVGPVMSRKMAPAFDRGDYIALGSKTRPEAWSNWLATHPAARPPSEIRYYDHHFLIVEAASAGLGVALSPFVLATDDICRERLIAPLGFDADGSQYGLIWKCQSTPGGVAHSLADWLKAECSRSLG